jgi:hypothetical protein
MKVFEGEGGGQYWYQALVHKDNCKLKQNISFWLIKKLKNEVVNVCWQRDMIILIKFIMDDLFLKVISMYALQVGHNESVKRLF